jgi:hypothetical protein
VFGDNADTRTHTRPAEPLPSAETDAVTLREPGAEEAPGDAGSSERPLDEVILDYLVESARQRKRRSK